MIAVSEITRSLQEDKYRLKTFIWQKGNWVTAITFNRLSWLNSQLFFEFLPPLLHLMIQTSRNNTFLCNQVPLISPEKRKTQHTSILIKKKHQEEDMFSCKSIWIEDDLKSIVHLPEYMQANQGIMDQSTSTQAPFSRKIKRWKNASEETKSRNIKPSFIQWSTEQIHLASYGACNLYALTTCPLRSKELGNIGLVQGIIYCIGYFFGTSSKIEW